MTVYDVLCQWNKKDGNYPKISLIVVTFVAKIVVTFLLLSPSRRLLLVFADLKLCGFKKALL